MPPKVEKKLPHLSVVVVGHIHSGKSNVTGHLLFNCGGVDDRTIKKFKKEAEEKGKETFCYAWALDKLKSERNRGITLDIALVQFDTDNFDVSIIDVPGHSNFIESSITGLYIINTFKAN